MKKFKVKPHYVIIPLLIAGVVYLIWWWLRNRSTAISQLVASNPNQTVGTGVGGGGSYGSPPVQSYDVHIDPLPAYEPAQNVPGTSGSGLPQYTEQSQNGVIGDFVPDFGLGPNYGPFNDSTANLAKAIDPVGLASSYKPAADTHADSCCDSCAGDCNDPSARYVDGAGACLALNKQQQSDNIAKSTNFDTLTQRVYDSGFGKWVDQIITDPSVYANYYPDFPRDF